jgi:Predicted ATPase (AAA+ superfamily)
MEALRNKYLRLINSIRYDFKRYLYDQINWEDRLIIIKGQRGVGKTTMILQYIKYEVKDVSKSLYISLDDIYFTDTTLSALVDDFVLNDGQFLFIDEVHRYPQWSKEIKTYMIFILVWR